MNDGISRIIERNIKIAMEQGVFENLPGKGKPQQLADLRFIPPEQRAAFLVMQNFGHLPLEMELRRAIAELEEQLLTAKEKDKTAIQNQIWEKRVQYDVLLERRKR